MLNIAEEIANKQIEEGIKSVDDKQKKEYMERIWNMDKSQIFHELMRVHGESAKLLMEAKEAGIQYSIFTNTMTEGTWEDQEARTFATKPEEIVYYGIVLFGPKEIVTNLTKKLSLFR